RGNALARQHCRPERKTPPSAPAGLAKGPFPPQHSTCSRREPRTLPLCKSLSHVSPLYLMMPAAIGLSVPCIDAVGKSARTFRLALSCSHLIEARFRPPPFTSLP